MVSTVFIVACVDAAMWRIFDPEEALEKCGKTSSDSIRTLPVTSSDTTPHPQRPRFSEGPFWRRWSLALPPR